MFLTAVCKIALVSMFFIPSSHAQYGRDYFLFIASEAKDNMRIVSDMHVYFTHSSPDTIDVEINILENWKAKDSLTNVFVRDFSSKDSLMDCKGRSIRVIVYKSNSGDRVFIQKPEKFDYFDNYGQQHSSWIIDFAAVEFQNPRKKYNSIFSCFYGK